MADRDARALADIRERLCAITGDHDALLTVNATAGFHALLLALELPPGSEVVFPVDCYPPLVMMALVEGLRPVLADVDRSGNLCPQSLAKVLSAQTRAVLVIHMAGVPADLARIAAVLEGWTDVALIEDSCQALGTLYGGAMRPSPRTAATMLSFSTSKFAGMGCGGALLSSREDLLARCRIRVDNGLEPRCGFTRIGYGYQFPDVLAPLLADKLAGLAGEIATRAESFATIAQWLPGAVAPIREGTVAWHKLVVRTGGALWGRGPIPELDRMKHFGESHYPTPIFDEKFWLDRPDLCRPHRIEDFPAFGDFAAHYYAFREKAKPEREAYARLLELLCA